MSPDQLVCKLQSLTGKVQIVNQEQVLAEKVVGSRPRGWAELVQIPTAQLQDTSLEITEHRAAEWSNARPSLMFFNDTRRAFNNSHAMLLPQADCQDIAALVDMEWEQHGTGCWLTWSEDSIKDIVPELLQAQEPVGERAAFYPQQGVESPTLKVETIMGTPNDILLNASSTITSALISGLSPKCRVYDLTYLRCQDLQLEMSGLLG